MTNRITHRSKRFEYSGDALQNLDSGFRTGKIANYSIQHMISCHGQGSIFLATDLLMKRKVILKVYRKSRSKQERRRLVNEARALSRLNGKCSPVCFGIEVSQDASAEFLVMEYIRGRTLRDLIGNGCVPIRIALEILLQATQALGIVHRAGLVHLDLKPSNLLVTDEGVVKLIDFGMVQAAGKVRTAFSGTPAYMGPERMGVDAGPIDHRADIFSLGAILYELLVGEVPFPSVSSRRNRNLVWDGVKVKTEALESLKAVGSICRRSLSKDPAARYQSAMEMEHALRKVISRHDAESRWNVLIAQSRSIANILFVALT